MIVDGAAYARIVAYARDRLRDDVEDLLDDPSDLLHPGLDQKPAEAIAELRQRSPPISASTSRHS